MKDVMTKSWTKFYTLYHGYTAQTTDVIQYVGTYQYAWSSTATESPPVSGHVQTAHKQNYVGRKKIFEFLNRYRFHVLDDQVDKSFAQQANGDSSRQQQQQQHAFGREIFF